MNRDGLDLQIDLLLSVGFRAICDDEDISEPGGVDDMIENTVFPCRLMLKCTRVRSHLKRRHAKDQYYYRKQIRGN